MKIQKFSGFGMKDCLTGASRGWNCFRTYNKDREFHTLNDKYVRHFIRKSIKGGRVADFQTFFESNHCEEILNTINNI